MKLALGIAWRFLSSNKGQTMLITLGIAVGISVQIFIGSLIEGLQISLLDATIGRSPHITITNAEKNRPIEDYLVVLQQLGDTTAAISSSVTGGAFVRAEGGTGQVLVRGFEIAAANKIYRFDEALIAGGTLPQVGERQIAMGFSLAEDYGIEVGDVVGILSPTGVLTEVTVAGLFDLRVAAVNSSWVVADLRLAQSMFGFTESQVTAIEMRIAEPFDSVQVAALLDRQLTQSSLKVTDWQAQNEALLSGLRGQSTSSLMIQVFVVISVVLGIASVLAISVLQKSRQIGILKAMGITDATASLVFLFQGAILGIFGGIFGIAMGVGLLIAFSTFALNPDGTSVVPVFLNYRFIALSGAIAVGAATIASISPALKSRTLSPIEVIKNG